MRRIQVMSRLRPEGVATLLEEVGPELEAKGVTGLRRGDGTFNISAIIRHQLAKSDPRLRNGKL